MVVFGGTLELKPIYSFFWEADLLCDVLVSNTIEFDDLPSRGCPIFIKLASLCKFNESRPAGNSLSRLLEF